MGGYLLRESETGFSLLGSDTRSFTEEDIFERQAGEGMLFDMESRQGQSQSEDTYQTDILRRIYRNVLIGGIHDLGLGDQHEVNATLRWVNKSSFCTCCQIAAWDGGWMDDLFRSVSMLSPSVRKPITRECIEMLRVLSLINNSDVPYGDVADFVGASKAKQIAYPQGNIDTVFTDSTFTRMVNRKNDKLRKLKGMEDENSLTDGDPPP